MKTLAWLAGAALAGLGAGMAAGVSPAWAQPKTDIIYSFPPLPKGQYWGNGSIADYGSGLVGVTLGQGVSDPTICPGGCGTVYRVNPPPLTSGRWTREVLHTFDPATEGATSNDDIFPPVVDPAGNIYGLNIAVRRSSPRTETVWKLSPPVAPSTTWTYSVIGTFPNAGMGFARGIQYIAVGKTGIVYVSTGRNYAGSNQQGLYNGSIYSLTPSGGTYVQATVHFFSNKSEGYYANAFTVLSDTKIVGFTDQTNENESQGIPATVFLLQLSGGKWTYQRLYDFGSAACNIGTAGQPPCLFQGPIVVDSKLDIILAAGYGGTSGYGEIVEISPPATGQTAWTEKSLHDFSKPGALFPSSGLTADKRTGAVFGILGSSGSLPVADGSTGSNGATYRLDPPASGSGPWTLTVLHEFNQGFITYNAGPMVYGRSGLLYGGASDQGGKGNEGFVYRQTPD